jgi:hypothetical protein
LEGTTADKMRDIYTRPHRNSIYEPATIHDIPFEILRESFLHLLKMFDHDLVAASLACRAWRAAALNLMNSRKVFIKKGDRIDSVIFGLHLRSIVGLKRCTIKHLVLEFVGKEYFPLIARVVSPTLSRLQICFGELDSSECFEECDGIRELQLDEFDFGDDPIDVSQSLRDGFGRLAQLDLFSCQGDIRMLIW